MVAEENQKLEWDNLIMYVCMYLEFIKRHTLHLQFVCVERVQLATNRRGNINTSLTTFGKLSSRIISGKLFHIDWAE